MLRFKKYLDKLKFASYILHSFSKSNNIKMAGLFLSKLLLIKFVLFAKASLMPIFQFSPHISRTEKIISFSTKLLKAHGIMHFFLDNSTFSLSLIINNIPSKCSFYFSFIYYILARFKCSEMVKLFLQTLPLCNSEVLSESCIYCVILYFH